MPITAVGFFLIGRRSHWLAALWLFLASLVFYSWWDYRFTLLLLASISFNFAAGRHLTKLASGGQPTSRCLAGAVAVDLLILGFFKYALFFTETFSAVTGSGWTVAAIALPVGVSFFTFTQIAFLCDAAAGKTKSYGFVHYGLFISYFPHLIAGPILHHNEIIPQFADARTYRPQPRLIAAGLAIFVIGLAKKLLLADVFAPISDAAFGAAATAGFITAWIGAVSFALQIYFDFSGYSDMAIGTSLMLGIKLPLNFASPYKSTSIVEFWRSWHMTLSRFLRDYIYVPLGGNRHGKTRRHLNLMTTMLLGGLWHGAAWHFVAWGGLHGLALSISHSWSQIKQSLTHFVDVPASIRERLGVAATFVLVVSIWTFFRSETFSQAASMLTAMSGERGFEGALFSGQLRALVSTVETAAAGNAGLPLPLRGLAIAFEIWQGPPMLAVQAAVVVFGLTLVFGARNSQEIIGYRPHPVPFGETPRYTLAFRSNARLAVYLGALFAVCLYAIAMARVVPFVYFQF